MAVAATLGAAFVLLALAATRQRTERPPVTPPPPAPTRGAPGGFLHGRVRSGNTTYEGRLRWGGTEEAFWSDSFNGTKDDNPWSAHVPADRLPRERRPLEILGIEMPRKVWGVPLERERPADLRRLFMARFGDIARIEPRRDDVHVTLKSGTVFALDRFAASDFDDGVRVWDPHHGVVDLDSLQVGLIELLPAPRAGGGDVPTRLHGTVRTRQGAFKGFLQWDRDDGTGEDVLEGRTSDGTMRVRFDTIRSIARRSPEGVAVTQADGRELVLSGTREVGFENRGLYVDDRRYGRVLVSWDAFERVDFSPAGSGPTYDDFPPGRPITGAVATRNARLAGRLVFDLDESETTETLDAPWQGVDYTIPFGLIASIVPHEVPPRVTLHHGEARALERKGDLGERNAGLLVFVEGRARPEYVPWAEVQRVDLDRPPAMYPPAGER